MNNNIVSIVRYQGAESVRHAVALAQGLDHLPHQAKVIIKPNIVTWTRHVDFPKWGVVTTSRVIEDVVMLLKERGIEDITIAEGGVTLKPKDTQTYAHAFESLGYGILKQRYGVNYINILERPFVELDLGAGVVLNYNTDILESDFVVNLPVLKTHSQAKVSLGIKNLKGMIDIPSRKKCHEQNGEIDLDYQIARLANKIPPSFTLIDGIYTIEYSPLFTGNARRSNLLVASADVLAADMVGSRLLGYDPKDIPHLVHAAHERGHSLDLSDLEVVGENIETYASYHPYAFPYNDEGTLPLAFAQKGLKGLAYRKYDSTLCTYCSLLPASILWGIQKAWSGQPYDNVEVLSGKSMQPTPGHKKTLLLGKCMYELNRDNPNIQEMVAVKGCPPQPKSIARAFKQAGVELDDRHLMNLEEYPGVFLKKYANNAEFDASFFTV